MVTSEVSKTPMISTAEVKSNASLFYGSRSYSDRVVFVADVSNSNLCFELSSSDPIVVNLQTFKKDITRKVNKGTEVIYKVDELAKNRFRTLSIKFEKELSRKLPINAFTCRAAFHIGASTFSRMAFKTADVELTRQNALKFSFRFADDQLLMISMPVEQPDGDHQVVFSYFEQGELILSDASDLRNLTQEIKGHLTV